MPRSCPFLYALVVGCFAALAGCGEDPPPSKVGDHESQPTQDEAWSDSASSAGQSAEAVVGRMAKRLANADGYGTAHWQAEAEGMADLLWPRAPGAELAPAVRTHLQVLLIAGDVARTLHAAAPSEVAALREELASSRTSDLAIHDAARARLAEGPTAWRTWIEADGQALLDAKRAELEQRLLNDR